MAPPQEQDVRRLIAHGWELSEDGTRARLFSEEWSAVEDAIAFDLVVGLSRGPEV